MEAHDCRDWIVQQVLEETAPPRGIHQLPFLDLPAFERAMAIACFCGRPTLISVLMLAEMTFLLEPFLSGIPDLLDHLRQLVRLQAEGGVKAAIRARERDVFLDDAGASLHCLDRGLDADRVVGEADW